MDSDNALQLNRLFEAFQAYFRQHAEHWLERSAYKEAGPHLLLPAFLQRIVNGGGRVEREYALGQGRTDLLVTWPQGARKQRFVIECKFLQGDLETAISKGLSQTAAYMDRCAADDGHLVIFDRDKRLWQNRVFRRSEAINGVQIEIWGM